ncbi:serine/threonine protein phosphatase, partial [Pseudomonas sp. SAS7]
LVDLCAELPCKAQGSANLCRSGLVSRKGGAAAPAMSAAKLKNRGRFAPRSRHKAAPTGIMVSL